MNFVHSKNTNSDDAHKRNPKIRLIISSATISIDQLKIIIVNTQTLNIVPVTSIDLPKKKNFLTSNHLYHFVSVGI